MISCQFYRCFVAFVKCGAEPQPAYSTNPQQSSREDAVAASSSLSPRRALSLRHPCKTPLHTERRTLSLVVHYTP